MNEEPQKRKRGRPLSQEARQRALHAAAEILNSKGLDALTIESVASRSGTGKPTLYRHWANALELGMDALMQEFVPPLPSNLESTPRAALMRQLDRTIEMLAPPRGTQIVKALANRDNTSEIAKRFRAHVLEKSRAAARDILERFVARGDLLAPKDMELLLDVLFAPLFYRVLMGDIPLDKALPAQLVDIAFATLEPNAARNKDQT
ncbi:MAG: TetR/AcrR family transcriptional regulator [Arenibacterium sp.]